MVTEDEFYDYAFNHIVDPHEEIENTLKNLCFKYTIPKTLKILKKFN